jgi:4-amino-4-deoxy-L-arabinose transferase-like glycosyltransferase
MLFAGVVLWPGLGSSGRLSYHEAFVAQGAREMLASGSWWNPTIGGLAWLEKPPLPWWLVAGLGELCGGVTEVIARLPTTLAAIGLVLGVAVLGARHYGATIGLMAGAIQATTAWVAMRGRLAEADMLLACLVTWTIVAFDGMRRSGELIGNERQELHGRRQWARWAFFGLLGMLSLVKGIGFGAVIVLAVVLGSVVVRRDWGTAIRLAFVPGWVVALVVSVAWPVVMLVQHGSGALSLWTLHVADRLAARPGAFAGEPWWEYLSGVLAQGLPWTPLAVVGAWGSLRRGVRGGLDGRQSMGDSLLWAWAIGPMVLLGMATVKNAHYAISAQVPWSIWAALGLSAWGARLERRGWARQRVVRVARVGFLGLALFYGLGYWLVGPWVDRRGREWAFYETAAREVPAGAPLVLLYDDWDRNPYESPFGAIPHDLAVRLFYLGRPASWHIGTDRLAASDLLVGGVGAGNAGPVYVIGRERDTEALRRLGRLDAVMSGPRVRFDRVYTLFRLDGGQMATAELGDNGESRRF